ncbi:MAG: Flp pilus assembly protein CpaB [Verrucomicrobia bacterium]|nr:Flp pilus assembly protein CpaB [Verrucomicrobiota bacterium]
MKEKLILVIAIVCGVAAMLLMQLHINNVRSRLAKQYEMVYVVAAAKELAIGTEIKPGDLGKREVSKKSISSRNITPEQMEMVMGRKLKNTVSIKAPLLWSDIVGDEQKGGNLAAMVNENERAVSIPVDMTSSVTGLIEPNDHVDILGTFTFPTSRGDPQLDTVTLTILQNVTILATGKDTARTLMDVAMRGGGQRRAVSYSTVTLLVTPKEAEMLVFAMQKGRLTLTLRNPSDVSSARDLTNINFNYLEKKVGEFNDSRQQRLKTGPSP